MYVCILFRFVMCIHYLMVETVWHHVLCDIVHICAASDVLLMHFLATELMVVQLESS